MPEKLVITGMGIVAPNGIGSASFAEALRAGRSGVRCLDFCEQLAVRTQVGGCLEAAAADALAQQEAQGGAFDRSALFLLAAARMARAEARLDRSEGEGGERTGILVASACGPVEAVEEAYAQFHQERTPYVRPSSANKAMFHSPALAVAGRFGLGGVCGMTCWGGVSSLAALLEATLLLRSGMVDVMLVGAVDCPFSPDHFRMWDALRLLTRDFNDQPEAASRPFDARRTGLVLAEGAAVIVLEREKTAAERNANVLAEVVGFGQSFARGDSMAARTAAFAASMDSALVSAHMAPGDLGHVQAAALSSPTGDAAEAAALRQVLGGAADLVPVSSIKSMIGHALGASGMLSLAAAVLGMRDGFLPPTINLDVPDADCDLNHVALEARQADYRTAMVNCSDFGGAEMSVIVRRP